MESNLDLFVTIMAWGAIAFVVWGASLTIGHLLSSWRPGDQPKARQARHEARVPDGMAGLH